MGSNKLLGLGFKASALISSILAFAVVMPIILCLSKDSASVIILLVYVDDLIVTGSNPDDINSMINALSSRFDMRNLGNLHFLLGMQA